MASFVESATLVVNDKSSAKINKINAELRKLFKTAQSLKKMKVDLGLNARGAAQAQRNIRNLQKGLTNLQRSGRRQITVRANVSQAQRAINQLQRQAQRTINMRIRAQTQGPHGPGNLGAGLRGVNWHGFGRQMGFGFQASVGNFIGQQVGHLIGAAGKATMDSEGARIRVEQAGFTKTETAMFTELSRKVQGKYEQIPAADVLNASVEQLRAITAEGARAGWSTAELAVQYEAAMERIAKNSQIMAITYKDTAQGAESARQLERFSQILGSDVDDAEIQRYQEAAMRAVIGSGGEISIEEAVRSIQQITPQIAKTMSTQAITDLLMIREQGGRSSTAEWRMAIQELFRSTVNPDDLKQQIQAGLRDKSGAYKPEVVKAAGGNLIDFVSSTIMPILEKQGIADADSIEIGAYLDEFVGFSTSAARAYADIATNLRSGNVERQREAAAKSNLDPFLANGTFAAAMRELSASFSTATARNLELLAPAFAGAMDPISDAMDKAGVLAQEGKYAEASQAILEASSQLLSGTAGTAIEAALTGQALTTLLSPGTSGMEKAAAVLQLAAFELLKAGASLSKSIQNIIDVKSGKKGIFEAIVDELGPALGVEIGGQKYDIGKMFWTLLGVAPAGAQEAPKTTDVFTVEEEKKRADAQRVKDLETEIARQGVLEDDLRRQLGEAATYAGSNPQKVEDLQAAVDGVVQRIADLTAELNKLNAAAAVPMPNPWDSMNHYAADAKEQMDKFVLDQSKVEQVGKITREGRKREADEQFIRKQAGMPSIFIGTEDEAKAALVEAIKKFQAEYGLLVDGIIGKQTDSVIRQIQSFDYLGKKTPDGEIPTPTARPERPEDAVISGAEGTETLLGGLGAMDDEWSQTLSASSAEFQAAITSGGISAGSSVSEGLSSGGMSAGAAMAAALIGAGPTVGAIIANAVSRAAANISVNVSQNNVNTGPQVAAA